MKKGVTVFKTDEKFLSHISEEETAYHFEYVESEDRWKFLSDENVFLEFQKTIEDAINSDEVVSIIQEFFEMLDTYLSQLTKLQTLDASGALNYVDMILEKADRFIQLQNAIGEVSDDNYI